MAITRAGARSVIRSLAIGLPEDCWIAVIARLESPDICRAICASKAFALMAEDIWRAACKLRWPAWAALANVPGVAWRRQFELLSLREREEGTIPDVAITLRTQSLVKPYHRAVLTEWLAEVSWDWRLDTTVLHRAVSYLDHYIQQHDIQPLNNFQLVGLACLRAAMGDHVADLPQYPKREAAGSVAKEDMDAQRFAHISDLTYSAQQVEDWTAVIENSIPSKLKHAPNAKMFLRSFWYRCMIGGLVAQEEMHIYALASFLLQLSVLDLDLAGCAPSLVAAAALCESFVAFGKDEWPIQMAGYTVHSTPAIAPVRGKLRQLQATVKGQYVRQAWVKQHKHNYVEKYQAEWSRVLVAMAAPVPLKVMNDGPGTPTLTPSSGHKLAAEQSS